MPTSTKGACRCATTPGHPASCPTRPSTPGRTAAHLLRQRPPVRQAGRRAGPARLAGGRTFATNRARLAHKAALLEQLAPAARARAPNGWRAWEAAGVPLRAHPQRAQALAHPQVQALGILAAVRAETSPHRAAVHHRRPAPLPAQAAPRLEPGQCRARCASAAFPPQTKPRRRHEHPNRFTPLMALAAAASTWLAGPAAAQVSQQTHLAGVAFGPGSGTDQMARLRQALGDDLKVPIVVENKERRQRFHRRAVRGQGRADGYADDDHQHHARGQRAPVQESCPTTRSGLRAHRPCCPPGRCCCWCALVALQDAGRSAGRRQKAPGKLDFGAAPRPARWPASCSSRWRTWTRSMCLQRAIRRPSPT